MISTKTLVAVLVAVISGIGLIVFINLDSGPTEEEIQAQRDLIADNCEAAIDDTIETSEALNNDLLIGDGVSFSEYNNEVTDLANEADAIDYPSTDDGVCEDAVNSSIGNLVDAHISASTYWDEAIYDVSISSRELGVELNEYWDLADEYSLDIEQAIDDLREGTESSLPADIQAETTAS